MRAEARSSLATARAATLLTVVLCGCGAIRATPHASVPTTETGVPGSAIPSPDRTPEAVPPASEGSEEDAIRGELYALVRAQAEYRARSGTYARGLGALAEVVDYRPGDGVRIEIVRATESGHSAIGRREQRECAIYVGEVSPPRDYVRVPEIVACERRD